MKNFIAFLILGLALAYIIFAFSYDKGFEDAKDFFIDEPKEYFIPKCGDCLIKNDYGWENTCNYTCQIDKLDIN